MDELMAQFSGVKEDRDKSLEDIKRFEAEISDSESNIRNLQRQIGSTENAKLESQRGLAAARQAKADSENTIQVCSSTRVSHRDKHG